MNSGAKQSASAAEETIAARCRRKANDPMLPPDIAVLMYDAAKALEWQELVLTGLSTRDKDVIGALSETITYQREKINDLHTHLQQHREVKAKTSNYQQMVERGLARSSLEGTRFDAEPSAAQKNILEELQKQYGLIKP